MASQTTRTANAGNQVNSKPTFKGGYVRAGEDKPAYG